MDFEWSLGSGTCHPQIDRSGNEYRMDAAEIMKGALSLGVERTD